MDSDGSVMEVRPCAHVWVDRVAQFKYGDDGLDVTKTAFMDKLSFLALNLDTLWHRYKARVRAQRKKDPDGTGLEALKVLR